MIKELDFDNIDEIAPILNRYRERFGENSIDENYIELIKNSVSNDSTSLYGAFDEDMSLKGIGFFGKASSRILLIFADGNLEYEKQLVSVLCDRFLGESSFVATGGSWIPWISDNLSQYFIEIGFTKYDRASMMLASDVVENLVESNLPEGMSFEIYSPSKRLEISDLIFRGNNGSVDQEVFPDFFGTPENCSKMLENIEGNRYGEYKEGSSWVLVLDNNIIGACFMTLKNGDAGYIPDIVIEPKYRGKGLGKTILVHSMKRQIESYSNICKIELDVTLRNNARYLYESLGFKTVEKYAMYTRMS
ncbi:MAG: GNAT family N-acetyltransferase [Candidatus Sifarchaeia archaeon]